MGFTDSIHDAYLDVYCGVKDYNDYTGEFKKDTIKAMTELAILLYSLDKNKPQDLAFAKAIAKFDWHKAHQGIDYCSEPSFQKAHPTFYTKCGRAPLHSAHLYKLV